jgi:hypothetical protein
MYLPKGVIWSLAPIFLFLQEQIKDIIIGTIGSLELNRSGIGAQCMWVQDNLRSRAHKVALIEEFSFAPHHCSPQRGVMHVAQAP